MTISRRYAWYTLAILSLINLVNYFDRNVIFGLFPQIKVALRVSDFELGLLGTAYMIVFSIMAIPFGILSDVWSRKKVIAIGLGVWSFFTFTCGLTRSYWQLFLCRSFVGIGESSYSPSATALIAECFPPERRAQAIGVFSVGMGVGGSLGIILGSLLGHYWGWRNTFFIVGIPGLFLTFAIWRFREPRFHKYELNMEAMQAPGHTSDINRIEVMENQNFPKIEKTSVTKTWQMIVYTAKHTPTLTLISLGSVATNFSFTGLIGWGPTFLSRYVGFTLPQAGIYIGTLGITGGILGTLWGGFFADLLLRRINAGRIVTAASGFLLGSLPCAGALLTMNKVAFSVFFFFAIFLFTWYNGPLTAAIYDVVNPRIKATVMGSYNLFVHLIGASVAPAVIGRLSDVYGLRTAMFALPIMALIGGSVILTTAKTVTKDMIAVRTRIERIL